MLSLNESAILTFLSDVVRLAGTKLARKSDAQFSFGLSKEGTTGYKATLTFRKENNRGTFTLQFTPGTKTIPLTSGGDGAAFGITAEDVVSAVQSSVREQLPHHAEKMVTVDVRAQNSSGSAGRAR